MLGIIFVKNKSEFSFWILGSGGELGSDTFYMFKGFRSLRAPSSIINLTLKRCFSN